MKNFVFSTVEILTQITQVTQVINSKLVILFLSTCFNPYTKSFYLQPIFYLKYVFLLLSESISEWAKDSYQNLFISKFPVKLNTTKGSTVSLDNRPKYWTTAGTIKLLFPPLLQERSPFWKTVNICETKVIEKLLEDGCSSQFLRKFLETALFYSLEKSLSKFFQPAN